MGLSYRLVLCFLLWGCVKLCYPQPLWFLHGTTHPPSSLESPVVVECREAQLVVTVSKDLFGTRKLIQASDLSLGPAGCEPLASAGMDAVVKFEVGLHECGNSVQMTDDALVYSTFLLHNPRPMGNLSILRTNRAEVPIECRYPRQGNVSSRAIQPTWVPFRTTVLSEERLVFSLRLMEDNWRAEKTSPTFHLGDVAHLQADVHTGGHPALLLLVDHCVATPTPDHSASPSHTIVDFHGCLVDGLYDGSSKFKAPRSKPDTLQFTVAVFHFANDSRHTVYITCHLKVIPAQQAPDQLNKACSFNQASGRWSPVEGTDDICECCNEGNCGSVPGSLKWNHSTAHWLKAALRNRRHATEEADITVGPLIFLGKAGDPKDPKEWASPAYSSATVLSLGLATVVLLVGVAVLLSFATRRHQAASSPMAASE
ncbi:zona pellucida sperm-binding protein 3-like [Ochotona curzoniae]|uniref:zona pellucida sperm-binding protein 3-like n=1 Tax=Ochotona curzoniae TaxID=130825 RepID=UPI001B34F6FC|nr:zona pellucida sperm-binding protein 3-like [Ochotona curzoniae]